MLIHSVQTHRSADDFPRAEHLAQKIAEVAADPVAVSAETEAMVINRMIDNAAVSAASLLRRPVTMARHKAQAHRAGPGAAVFGVDGTFSAEWAAWANGVAVRELDYHDTFLDAEYSHPGDNIPPLVAVAQQLGVRGADLIRGLATAYEIQIDLVKGICLHEHKIDHVAHLGPSVARPRINSAPRTPNCCATATSGGMLSAGWEYSAVKNVSWKSSSRTATLLAQAAHSA